MKLGAIRRIASAHRTLMLAGVMALIVGASVASATIPDSGGVIHGCLQTQNGVLSPKGSLRVIDPSTGASCKSSEQPISWNQTGPQGTKGDPGPSTAYAQEKFEPTTLPNDSSSVLVTSKDLPPGTYVVNAKLLAENRDTDANSAVSCTLLKRGASSYLDTTAAHLGAVLPGLPFTDQEGLVLQATLQSYNFGTDGGTLDISCSQYGSDDLIVAIVQLAAIKVGEVQ
jgi:hypothetical protein